MQEVFNLHVDTPRNGPVQDHRISRMHYPCAARLNDGWESLGAFGSPGLLRNSPPNRDFKGTLVENRPNVAGRMTLLSRAASRDKGGATKGHPFVAGRLRPAT
jgi:hypothetical protein